MRSWIALPTVMLGLCLSFAAGQAQVDWDALEGNESIVAPAPQAPPPHPAPPAVRAPRPVAPVATSAAVPPQAKGPRQAAVKHRRAPRLAHRIQPGFNTYTRPKRPELAREFPLEDIDVASLLRPRQSQGPAPPPINVARIESPDLELPEPEATEEPTPEVQAPPHQIPVASAEKVAPTDVVASVPAEDLKASKGAGPAPEATDVEPRIPEETVAPVAEPEVIEEEDLEPLVIEAPPPADLAESKPLEIRQAPPPEVEDLRPLIIPDHPHTGDEPTSHTEP